MFGESWAPAVANTADKKKAGDIVSNIPPTATPSHSDHHVPSSHPRFDKAIAAITAAKIDWTLPIVIGIIGLLTLVAVLVGSGGVPGKNTPKTLLFVISGLKGTEFMDAVVNGPYAPNMVSLVASGSFAACLHSDDGRCCRTQDGPHFGGDFTFGSAPGIASILTGVNSNKHRINNDSFDAMSHFLSSSSTYPTVLKMAKAKGFSTAVTGSRYMMATLGETGRCSEFGVLDFECGDDSVARCLARSSCNTDIRIPLATSYDITELSPVTDPVLEYSRANGVTASDTSKIFDLTNNAVDFISSGTDVVVVHVNALELASNNAAAGGDYTTQSKTAMSALYLVDAVVGQIKSIIAKRVAQSRENWLVVGVSDHGGYNSSNGKTNDEDELVAFFASTYTLAGHLALQAPLAPVRQYDVAPTILKWMGIAAPAYMDGKAQMICSDGINIANCSETEAVISLN